MNRYAFALLMLFPSVASIHAQSAKENDIGIAPKGADGKPLNLDFETGTLQDWTAKGDAFKEQPILGDTVAKRRGDMKSNHQGKFWIGGYERFGDQPKGTLTSASFKITHPWASFLVGGGPWPKTCVELVRKDTGKVFFKASGIERENMQRVVVDLKDLQGKEMFVRLVDMRPGHWGHVNYDDFRFHAKKPSFPPRPSFQAPPPPDVLKFAGLTPEKAAQVMTVPEGFDVTLFAGEPDVHQPIALCLDDRGRVWVAEAYTYPTRNPHKGPVLPKGQQGDRIMIFEDTDGDGKFDKKKVFMEGLNLVSGLEVGFGGVWVGAAPYLLFIPDKNHDDEPDGPPQILLDGWGYQDTHETLNAFIWGPDGWLYGCHGVFTHSRVGKPGTPDEKRVPINAGIWRYHPTKHVFEVFAHGTSNPWGLDYNDYGQFFVEACVIPHAFHIIQGARYHRQAGSHFNPYTYADIKTIADHRHYIGKTPHSGNNRSDGAGGGHAHCGTMIYLGGAWPKKYHNQFFMGNIHGRRINMDKLIAKGSGYVASHGKDFLLANDEYARFINMRYGPDGNVYLIDWYDKQACHNRNPQIWDRTNGRIYKISFRGTKPVTNVDLSKLSDEELVKLQTHENDWYVRHARRLLQERKPKDAELFRTLDQTLREHNDPAKRLRALWAYHVAFGEVPIFLPVEFASLPKYLEAALKDRDPHIRAWAIQLICERGTSQGPWGKDYINQFEKLAAKDSSPVVRLYLASACQRLPLAKRWDILANLLKHREDASDHNLPLMYWYALEPLVEQDPARALELAQNAKMPPILSFMVRRIASLGTPESIALLVGQLSKSNDADLQLTYLQSINNALKGRRDLPAPKNWPEVFGHMTKSDNQAVRSQALALAITFGDTRAFDTLRQLVVNSKAELSLRQQALSTLLAAKDKELPPILQKLVADDELRAAALRGLAFFNNPKTPKIILGLYAKLNADEKRDALSTLASRVSFAQSLLDALATKKIASKEVPADIIRQLSNLKNEDLNKQIAKVWGIVRTTPLERQKLIAKYSKLVQASVPPADPSLGRAIFAKTCARCHTLFGEGGDIGPDITGANRSDLHYILENVLDPSAVIQKEYAASIVALNDGRVITGIVKNNGGAALTVFTANETLTLAKSDIDFTKTTEQSMMPDDQLKPMSNHEVRSLVAYLQSKAQVPMLATKENAKDFFNGKDLTNWIGDPKLWSVKDGEIIGKSPGLKKNVFLRSQFTVEDFELTLQVKLTPNTANSGIQFRSQPIADGQMKGLQADIGKGWWGKLYDEHGRGLLWAKSGEEYLKEGDWNEYKISAQGNKIRTWLNGKECVNFTDDKGPRRGIIALQLHSGPAMAVRFKDLRLVVGK